jgi:hypothetical protein
MEGKEIGSAVGKRREEMRFEKGNTENVIIK